VHPLSPRPASERARLSTPHDSVAGRARSGDAESVNDGVVWRGQDGAEWRVVGLTGRREPLGPACLGLLGTAGDGRSSAISREPLDMAGDSPATAPSPAPHR
jgi:hypothetical protein